MKCLLAHEYGYASLERGWEDAAPVKVDCEVTRAASVFWTMEVLIFENATEFRLSYVLLSWSCGLACETWVRALPACIPPAAQIFLTFWCRFIFYTYKLHQPRYTRSSSSIRRRNRQRRHFSRLRMSLSILSQAERQLTRHLASSSRIPSPSSSVRLSQRPASPSTPKC